MKTLHNGFSQRSWLRLILVAIALASSLFIIRAAARHALSQLLITYALSAGNLTAANKAIQLTPQSAEAHLAGAALLAASGLPDQAVTELNRAVSLRPADYFLWSQLGLLRDQTGDFAGALSAFDESIRRAPYYSQPRWYRGNLLLRRGQYETAFADLNQAAQSNPELIPNVIDLAWGISRGDVALTQRFAKIDNGNRRIAFARLLARQGKAADALAQLKEAGTVSEPIKREIIDQMLSKGAFREAFAIWNNVAEGNTEAGPSIYDGGFEGSLSFGEGGFSWRVPRDLQGISVSLDSGTPHTGAKDLRIEFNGNPSPALAIVSQLVPVEPSKHYRINFGGRSQELVTGGLPLLVASDAQEQSKILGKSASLAKGSSDWQIYSFEITTGPQTNAVLLSLQRENCGAASCPIFGSVLLDSFSLEQLH